MKYAAGLYNEERKMEFISSYTDNENTKRLCITLFKSIADYENAWGADICTRQEEELIPVVESLTGVRFLSRTRKIVILKRYIQWCIERSVPNATNGLKNVENVLGLNKLRTQMVSSPNHLQKYLDDVLHPEDMNTTDNTVRCFYWLAYGGMQEMDIMKVKVSDVDFDHMAVKYYSTEVPIYREAVKAFRYCVNSDAFLFYHPNYASDKRTMMQRVPGDLLLRGYKSEPNYLIFRNRLSRHSKAVRDAGRTNMELTYHRVWLSGLFYRVYEDEQIGIEPDFRPIISQLYEDKEYKLDKANTTARSKLNQLAKEYTEDYQRWKLLHRT